MARRTQPPLIDRRKASELARQVRGNVPHYTPEWPADQDADPGVALLDAFSAIAGGVIQQLNQAPAKNFIEFLNMLGLQLLPARPAIVPVQFRVNPGTEAPILVRARAQCNAPADADRPDQLFETTSDLLAVASAMEALVATDPFTDAIFKPPSTFLDLERAAVPLPPYQTASFSAAGSKTFQLDRVDDLDEGDVLRIGGAGSPDLGVGGPAACDPSMPGGASPATSVLHLVVAAKPEGRIVPLTEPLPQDIPPGTFLEKVTDFTVFDAKNLQEHVLYLGHEDLFNVESAAEFEIRIKHLAGSAANLSSLDIVWEYAAKPESGDDVEWKPFELEADTSAGFSRDGSITVLKPAGEIAEAEISGAKSRWIRGRVAGPIPAVPPPKLPRLDQVTFLLTSDPAPGEEIVPDLAFHNDTPLELPYLPFGPEPRQFDRFYLASQEVFSKKNADVTLTVELASEALFETPAGIFAGGMLHFFSRGPAGGLTEIRITPDGQTDPEHIEHQALPEETTIAFASAPAAVSAQSDTRLFTFVRGENGAIYERLFDRQNNQRFWKRLFVSGNVSFVYDPAATVISNLPYVFAVGTDGKLYNALINVTSGFGTLKAMDGPAAGIASAPTVVSDGADVRIYVVGADGKIYEAQGLGTPPTWTAANPGGSLVAHDPRRAANQGRADLPERSRVFAQIYPDGNIKVTRLAFRAENDHLVELDVGDVDAMTGVANERDLSDPGTNTDAPTVASAPTGVFLDPGLPGQERRHLFIRDDEGDLWQRSSDDWIRHDRPGGAGLRPIDPAAVHFAFQPSQGARRTFLSVLSVSEKNLPVEFRQRLEEPRTAQGGPRRLLALAVTASSSDQAYETDGFVRISSSPGSDAFPREIARYSGRDRVLRLAAAESPWPAALDETSTYQILRRLTFGASPGATTNTLELDTGASGFATAQAVVGDPGRTAIVRMIPDTSDPAQDQYRAITSLDAGGDALVDANWNPEVTTSVDYEVFENLNDGTVSANTFRSIVLASNSPEEDDFYTTGSLRILGGTGQDQTGTITVYSGRVQVARLDWDQTNPPNPEPDGTSVYQVTGPAGWLEYENPLDQELRPTLSWEYWNGRGWISLQVTPDDDETNNLLNNGTIQFRMPRQIEQTEVAGQENFWIRVRLIGGDYGRETFTPSPTGTVQVNKDLIDPPVIQKLTIGYQLVSHELPQKCLTSNNLGTLDQTAACSTPGKHFEPFQPLEDDHLALYLGFEKPLAGGPIGVLFVADELPVADADRPKMTWFFRSDNEWKDVKADDSTEGLVRQGILTLNVPENFQLRSLFGHSLYWVRGSLVKGDYVEGRRPRLLGVFPNTADTVHSATVADEILGSSDGEGGQGFAFLPAADGDPPANQSLIGQPEVRVREFLSPEESEQVRAELGEDGVVERDVLGETQMWVRWTEVNHFFESSDTSRHYRLDRARARIRFGDGHRGMIPPAGTDNIRAFSYRAGGGLEGNVDAGEVNALVTAIAGIDSVLNPVEAGGGGDRAPVEEMLRIGPARISHRDRAVTPEDFEWLSLEASREVVKARCRPNFQAGPSSDPDDEGQTRGGWVTVYILPRDDDDLPKPSLALQRTVQRYLAARAETGLATSDRIAVRAPRYVPVSVEADVFVVSIDRVAAVELEVGNRLREFLHPLRGGPEGEGWEFGRPVAGSDVFVALEAIDGVDHVENLTLHFGDRTSAQLARVRANELIAWADPQIRLAVI